MRKNLSLKLRPLPMICLLLLVLALGSVALGILVQTNPYIKVFDQYFYELLSRHYHSPLMDLLIRPFNFNFLPAWAGPLPSYMYFMILAGIIILFFWQRQLLPRYILTILLGAIIVYLVTILDYRIVFRDRPFATLPNSVGAIGWEAWQKISSFPSGHVRETVLFGTILSAYIPILKWPMIVFVLFIAYSRVYVGAHFPTDVLAGVLIGFLAARVALMITQELQGRWKHN